MGEEDILIDLSEVVNDGMNYMKRVMVNESVLTDAIKSKNEDKISKNYYQLKEGLQWIENVIERSEYFLEIDYFSLSINKQNASRVISEFKEYIEEIEVLFSDKQYEQLESMIENQLSKQLKKIISLFNKVKGIIKEKQN
jgi:hypothetical protein